MALSVKLTAFEGPLDLLLHLIDKNKIDIYDIPIVQITDQYLEYIRDLEIEDMELASEFMVMAATLLDIKCSMLLPKDEDEETSEGDPREELVKRLMEYKKYKYMSAILREQMEYTGVSVTKEATLPPSVMNYRPSVDLDELLEEVTLEKMLDVYKEVLRRRQGRIDPVRSRFSRIEKEPVSVGEQMRNLQLRAIKERRISFREFIDNNDKINVVVSFLAVLELIHYGKIGISQEELFGEIIIESLEARDAQIDESIFGEYNKRETEGEAEFHGY